MHQWISRCFWVHFCLKKSPCKKVKAVYPTTQVLGLRKKWDGCALAAREPDRKNRTVKLCILGPNVIFSAHWPNEDGWHWHYSPFTCSLLLMFSQQSLADNTKCRNDFAWIGRMRARQQRCKKHRNTKRGRLLGLHCALGSLEGTLDYRTAPLSAHFSATTWYSLRRLGACNCSDLRRPCACD